MPIYQFLTNVLTKPVIRRHYNRGRAIGLAEAYAERLAELDAKRHTEAGARTIADSKPEGWLEGWYEGRIAGIAEANRRWTGWYQRLLDAAANNLPFDEPPPINPDGGHHGTNDRRPGRCRIAARPRRRYRFRHHLCTHP